MIIKYKDRPWLIMQCLKDFGPQSRDQLTSYGSNEEARASITNMLRANLIRVMHDGLIDLTLVGTRRLRAITEDATGSLQIVGKREHTNGSTTEAYTAKELRRTCLRPGAYDAFEKPSLIGGERHYRREIQA